MITLFFFSQTVMRLNREQIRLFAWVSCLLDFPPEIKIPFVLSLVEILISHTVLKSQELC